MKLSDKSGRGSCVLAFDKVNQVIIGQWNDNKVVNFVSTLNDGGLGTIRRRVHSEKKEFPCPIPLIHYQKHMFAVDKGDQMRMHQAGFCNEAHFKKWYKRIFLGVLDCGLLNGLIAWNLSCKTRSLKRNPLKRYQFHSYVAQALCVYKDPYVQAPISEVPGGLAAREDIVNSGHDRVKASYGARCVVCSLEWCWKPKEIKEKGLRDSVAVCTKCHVSAHTYVQQNTKERGFLVHEMEEFRGKSLF